ncbi:MAG: general secretion pathway protein GspB [Syntrophobacteraceae bacterium]
MSYILDALKESEKKHQRRKSPDLTPEHKVEVRLPKRRVFWPYLLAFAMLLNVGLLVWWLRPWHQERRAAPASEKSAGMTALKDAPKPAPKTAAPLVEKSVEPVKHQPVETLPLEKQNDQLAMQAGNTPDSESEPQTLSAIPSASRESARKDENQSGRPSKPPQTTASPSTEPIPPEPPARHDPGEFHGRRTKHSRDSITQPSPAPIPAQARAGVPENTGQPETSRPAKAKQSPKQTKPEETTRRPRQTLEQPDRLAGSKNLVSDLESLTGIDNPSAKTAVTGKAPRIHELPSNVRGAIPKLSVSMLIYSKNSADRWININGSKRREGQEISTGLRVEEITPDGAFFSYQGHRFFKGVVGD